MLLREYQWVGSFVGSRIRKSRVEVWKGVLGLTWGEKYGCLTQGLEGAVSGDGA